MTQEINKPLLVILIAASCLILILGFLHIKGAILAPFNVASPTLSEEEILARLMEQDTDNDGLSDFEERFNYKTSAYIPDSDSDGFSDQQEVEAESNPLDPSSTPYQKESGQETPLEQVFVTEEEIEASSTPSAEEIRGILVDKGGLSQELVDNLDDKTLLKLYNETKQETGIDLENLEMSQTVGGQFSDLDIAQLRQLLVQQGVNEEKLKQLDDETLKALFLQSFLEVQP